jgi:hypothetical protein
MLLVRCTYSFISLPSKLNILASSSLILTIVSENPHSHHNTYPVIALVHRIGAVLLEFNIAPLLAMEIHTLR